MCIKSNMGDKGASERCGFFWICLSSKLTLSGAVTDTRQCPSPVLGLGCLLGTIRQWYCRGRWQHQGPGVCTNSCLSRDTELSTAAGKTHSSCLHGDKSSMPKSSATSYQLLCPSRAVQPHLSGPVQFSLSCTVEKLCFIILRNMKV